MVMEFPRDGLGVPTGWASKFHGVGRSFRSFIQTRQILTFLSENDKSLFENGRNLGKKV